MNLSPLWAIVAFSDARLCAGTPHYCVSAGPCPPLEYTTTHLASSEFIRACDHYDYLSHHI